MGWAADFGRMPGFGQWAEFGRTGAGQPVANRRLAAVGLARGPLTAFRRLAWLCRAAALL